MKIRSVCLAIAVVAIIGCDSTPEVAIDSPAPADTVAEAVAIAVTAIDNDSVSYVELWVDGDSTGLVDDSEPFTFRWNSVEHGSVSNHAIVAVAVDIDGNRGTDTVAVTVNNRGSYPEQRLVDSTSFVNGRYTLRWIMSQDGDFASYRVERSAAAAMTEADTIFTSTRRSDTTFTDRNMDFLTHNHYRIVVTDTLGFESPGPVLRSDLYPPPVAADVTAIDYDLDSMTVTWSRSNSENFVEYRLLTASSETGSKSVAATIDEPTVTSHALSQFDPTRQNWFWILTRNVFEQTTLGAGMTHEPDPLPVPLAVTAVSYNLKELTVEWEASPDNDFRRNELLHSRTEDGIRSVIASFDDPAMTRHIITDFDPTHENWFWVRTTDHWGQRAFGSPMTHKPDPPPGKIAVRSVTYDLNAMTVKWRRSRDRDFLSYEVLRSESEMGEKELLEIITNRKRTTYKMKSFNPGSENWFWVRVTDYWGQTYLGPGRTHTVDPHPAPSDVDSVWYDEQKITVTWSSSQEEDFSHYQLYVSDTEFGARRKIVKIGSADRNSYVLRHFDPTKENWFSIDVVDKWGLTTRGKGATNEANSPPEAIRITAVDYNFEQFDITWRKSAQTDFSFYDLLVSEARDGPQRRLVTLTSPDDTVHTIAGRGVFDPSCEQWFTIRTGDIWGQETSGPGFRVIDDAPLMSDLRPVEYRKGKFIFRWSGNSEEDFRRYTLYESMTPDMLSSENVYTSEERGDTSAVLNGIDPWESRFYALEVEDVWGLKTVSTVVEGSSESWFITALGDERHDEGRAVAETSDGGFIVAGHTYANEDNGDVWLVKTDPKGNIDWAETYGGDGDDHAYSVQVTSDGGYVMAGFSEALAEKWSDAWVIKTDDKGRVEWNRTYGGFRWDKSHNVKQTSDGGYIITGYTFSHGRGSADIWLIKADASGYPVWTQTFGGPDWEYGYAVEETDDGGFIITGFTETEDKKSSRIWLVRTDSHGEEQWTQTFGSRDQNEGYSVAPTSDGGFIVAGISQAFFPNYEDVVLIRTDTAGEVIWERSFGGQSWDRAAAVRQTSDGGFLVAGSSQLKEEGNANAWLMKIDLNGDPLWERRFESGSSDVVHALQITSDGGCVLAGASTPLDGGPADLLLIKTDARGIVPESPVRLSGQLR